MYAGNRIQIRHKLNDEGGVIIATKRKSELSPEELPPVGASGSSLSKLVRNLLSSMVDVTGKKSQLSEDARRKSIRDEISKADLR